MGVAETALITVVHRAVLTVETERAVQIVDLTPLVASVVRRVGLVDGLVAVTTRHTTTGLIVNEHEPLLRPSTSQRCSRGSAPPTVAYAHDDLRPSPRRAGQRTGQRARALPGDAAARVGDGASRPPAGWRWGRGNGCCSWSVMAASAGRCRLPAWVSAANHGRDVVATAGVSAASAARRIAEASPAR